MKLPLFIYTLSATLESFLMIPYTMKESPCASTHNRYVSYQNSQASASGVATLPYPVPLSPISSKYLNSTFPLNLLLLSFWSYLHKWVTSVCPPSCMPFLITLPNQHNNYLQTPCAVTAWAEINLCCFSQDNILVLSDWNILQCYTLLSSNTTTLFILPNDYFIRNCCPTYS
jgi:hypothetical protein